MQRNLQTSTAKMTNAFHLLLQMPAPVAVLAGEQFIIEAVNEKMLEAWGKSSGEVLHLPFCAVFYDHYTNDAAHRLQQVYQTGVGWSGEVHVHPITADGAPAAGHQFYFTALKNEQGHTIGILVTDSDITEAADVRKKLLASESFNRTALESNTDCVKILDTEGHLLYMNHNGLCTLDIDDFDRVKNKQWWELWPEENRGLVQDAVQKAVQGHAAQFEAFCPTAKGTPRWWEVTVSPDVDEEGKVRRLLSISRDITKQKQAIADLALTLRHVPSAIYHLDKWGNILYLNDLAAKQMGYDSVAAVQAEKDVYAFRKKLDESFDIRDEAGQPLPPEKTCSSITLATGKPSEVVMLFTNKKDGTHFCLLTRSVPLFDKDGRLEKVFTSCTDITAQKAASAKLVESEERFRAMAESADMFIAMGDESSNAIYFNKAWTTLTGRPAQELLRFGWTDLVHPEDRNCFLNIYLDAFAQKEPFTGEFRIKNNAGKYRWLLAQGSPRFLPDGAFAGYISTCVDITERKHAEEELLKSELRFRSLVAEAPVATCLFVGRELKIEVANDIMIGYWGKDSSIIGKPLAQAVPELEGQPFLQILDDVFTTGNTYAANNAYAELETAGVLRQYYFDFTYKPLRNQHGAVYAILEMAVDVTAEVMARKKLEESESRFRAIANDTPAFIFMADAQTHTDFLNRQLLEFIGADFEQAKGKVWADITHPDDVPPMMEAYSRAIAAHQPYQFEIRQRAKDGTYHHILWKGIPRIGAGGAFEGMLGVGIDVTESRLALEALKSSEQQLQQLSDFVPQIVWSTDSDGRHDFFNKQWYQFTGISSEETKAAGWKGALHPDDYGRARELWQHCISTGDDYGIEYRLRRWDGAYRWLLARATPFRNEAGDITRWFGTGTDIHDQKNMAERLELLVAERTKALQRSNEDLQQFAHVSSHDLKEPIRKIRTFASRLSNEYGQALPDKAKLYLAKMEQAGERIYTMIEGVLRYSALDAAEQKKESVDLNKVVEQIVSDLEIPIAQKEATVRCAHLPQVEGHTVLLYQLFYNLFNNSLKFARHHTPPVIHFFAAQTNRETAQGLGLAGGSDYISISVQDNGIGFSNEMSQSIFATFARLHSKDSYEGTGLGLALCKKIAERHGGAIKASGTEGAGAVFTVILPRKQPAP